MKSTRVPRSVSQQFLYWSVSYTYDLINYIPCTVFSDSLEVANNPLRKGALEAS